MKSIAETWNETCAICGSALEIRRKCFSCGRIVCRDCVEMQNGVHKCHRCTGKKKVAAPRNEDPMSGIGGL